MQDRALRSLTREVMAPDATEPFGAYLFAADEPGAELGRHVEREVFFEAFGDSDDLLDQEYGPYDASSWFIVVIDHLRRLPVGVLRVVRPSPVGLKSLHDLESVWGESVEAVMERAGIDFSRDKAWDIGTLAVLRDYRRKATGGLVTMGLYQTLTLAAFASGIELFVTIFDMPVFRLMRWKLRMVFAGYPGVGPMPYLGSPAAIPAWCDVVECERRLAEADPDLHAILCRGTGLEPAMRPADLGLALRKTGAGVAAS